MEKDAAVLLIQLLTVFLLTLLNSDGSLIHISKVCLKLLHKFLEGKSFDVLTVGFQAHFLH